MSYPPHAPLPPSYGHPPNSAPPYSAAPYSPAPGYPQPGYPQQVMVVGPPTSGTAVASLVLGILGAVGGWCLFAAPCLVAVILGHAALADVKRSHKAGRGMAVAGLVLGYVFGLPWAVLTVMMLMGAVTAPFTATGTSAP